MKIGNLVMDTSVHPQGCVLVTDGNERSALAVTRGLGQEGIPVVVGAETDSSLAGASRYCVSRCRYPSPLSSPVGFISSIQEAIKEHNLIQIISVTDAVTQVLAEHRAELPPSLAASIPLSTAYDAVSDKYQLMHLARELNVPIPETVFVHDGNVEAVLNQVKQYPVVVKPGRSLVQVKGRWEKSTVHFVSNRDELIELYGRIPYLRHPSMIQRRVQGSGEGIFGLFDRGKPLVLFAHRRIREKPPAGGVSVLRESIALPKPMTDYAVRLLEHVEWCGVAMVEFKVDRVSDTPMLMEINGRFWGSLQLAIDSGLNFPYFLYQMHNGACANVSDQHYRIGTRSRWLLGDIDHLLLRLTRSNVQLRLDSTAPSRWSCVLDFVKLFQRDLYYEIERLEDPAPALLEYRTWLAQLIGGRT